MSLCLRCIPTMNLVSAFVCVEKVLGSYHATTVDLVQVVANIKHDELPRKPFKIPTKPRRRERLTFDKAQTPESDNQDMSCRVSWHLHDQIHDQQFSLDPADDTRLSFSSGIMTPTFLHPPGQLRAGKSQILWRSIAKTLPRESIPTPLLTAL
ncbi:hypothetical protein E6O75_ATG07877 [Venturia nashicola]|uniref:Uncharacterized protein n=1 Tax=Venturia nashicola TaxID=86259 RepID=A0A4Z1NWT9_9PEZI|nr:hypothetical protein E6O75_ATG07877 [Venturia nashicola]